MARQQILASLLYRDALSLKRLDFKTLSRRKNRDAAILKISEMQFLTACMSLDRITDGQTDTILSELRRREHSDLSEISAELKEAAPDADVSERYNDLLFQMQYILSACQRELAARENGYTQRVLTYAFAFHNLPRAFLSMNDSARISPDEARAYADSYINKV